MNARVDIDPNGEPEHAHEILETLRLMSQQFMQCHQFLAKNTHALSELLREAESRGVLLHEALALADRGRPRVRSRTQPQDPPGGATAFSAGRGLSIWWIRLFKAAHGASQAAEKSWQILDLDEGGG